MKTRVPLFSKVLAYGLLFAIYMEIVKKTTIVPFQIDILDSLKGLINCFYRSILSKNTDYSNGASFVIITYNFWPPCAYRTSYLSI